MKLEKFVFTGIWGYAMLFVLAVPVFWSCGKSQAGPEHTAPARVDQPVKESQLTTLTLTPEAVARLGITSDTVAYRKTRETRTVGGELLVPPGQLVVVSAPAAGVLLSTGETVPPAGSAVLQGQALFQLLVLPAGGDLISTPEELAEQEVRLKSAQAKAERALALYQANVGSLQQYEEAQAELATVEAALNMARNRLEMLSKPNLTSRDNNLATLPIEAPAAGVLSKIQVLPGQIVAAGVPLFEISRLQRLWLRVPLYAGEVAAIESGMAVEVNRLGTPDRHAYRLARPISAPPSADPLSASIDIFFELDNRDNAYRPGERVSVTLPLAGAESSLTVPYRAILYDIHGGSWIYEQTAPDTFVRRRIEIASVTGDYAVISRGPGVGTRVVVDGAAELFGSEFGGGK